MSLELWLSNLWFYSLQTGILILVAGVLAWIFRFREPGALYLYWRLLLAGCLILAFQPGVPESLPDPAPAPALAESVFPASPAGDAQARPIANLLPWLGGLLISGIVLRLIWLGIGLYRLHRLKLRTRKLLLPPHLRRLKEDLGVFASFRVSAEVSSPVTFGYFQPVVIFPASFTEFDENMQRAVACHEALHVKRRDWLWTLLDEVIRTLFWFHPAFHWLVGRIQLTRELMVDETAVRLLGTRKTYLQSLVEFVKRGSRASSLPAPLFLKESQLSHRVRLLLQRGEVKLSKTKTRISLVVSLVMLAMTGWWSLTALPLTAHPPERHPQLEPDVRDAIHVGSNVMKSKLIHRVDPEYLSHLTVARPKGLVVLSVLVDTEGVVQQVKAVQGDKDEPALDVAAMDAVRKWRYEPYLLDGKPISVRTTVFVNFPPAGTVPQVVTQKKGTWSEIGSVLKETRRVLEEADIFMSEMARIFPHSMGEKKEVRDEIDRLRKEIERVTREMAGIDLQTMLNKKHEDRRKITERVLKEMERARMEIERVRYEMYGPAFGLPDSRESGDSLGP